MVFNRLFYSLKHIAMREKFKKWLRRNNMMFSAIAGETFTNAEVLYTHIGLVAFFVVLIVFGGD